MEMTELYLEQQTGSFDGIMFLQGYYLGTELQQITEALWEPNLMPHVTI